MSTVLRYGITTAQANQIDCLIKSASLTAAAKLAKVSVATIKSTLHIVLCNCQRETTEAVDYTSWEEMNQNALKRNSSIITAYIQRNLIDNEIEGSFLEHRTRNALMFYGNDIDTLEKLSSLTEGELLAISNVGVTMVSEIKKHLSVYGFSLSA